VEFKGISAIGGVRAGLDNLLTGVKDLGEPFDYAQGIARPYRSGKIFL